MVGISDFIFSSSGIDRFDPNEFTLKHAGDWVIMYCPREFVSVTYIKTKKSEKGAQSDTKSEVKEFTLTTGQDRRHENKEGREDQPRFIDLRVTLVAYKMEIVTIDPDTEKEIVEVNTFTPSAGAGNVGNGDGDGNGGGAATTSNAGFYVFLFIVLALVVVGGYLWYKKKLPGQEDSIIADIKGDE